MFDGAKFGAEMVEIIKGYMERRLGPIIAENQALKERVAALEVRKDASSMIYRGVYSDQQRYTPGDTVTWAGSCWHCNEPTAAKPGEGSKAWVLMVKRGADAKAVRL